MFYHNTYQESVMNRYGIGYNATIMLVRMSLFVFSNTAMSLSVFSICNIKIMPHSTLKVKSLTMRFMSAADIEGEVPLQENLMQILKLF